MISAMENNIKLLAGQFVEATTGMLGTDEDAVQDIAKKVHDVGAGGEFEVAVRDTLGGKKTAHLLAKYNTPSIVMAIFSDELRGSELKKATDYYEFGAFSCSSGLGEDLDEGFTGVFDMSGTAKKFAFAGGALSLGAAFLFTPHGLFLLGITASGLGIAGVVNGVMTVFGNSFCPPQNDTSGDNSQNTEANTINAKTPGSSRAQTNKSRVPLNPQNNQPQNGQSTDQFEFMGVRFTETICFKNVTSWQLPEDPLNMMLTLDALSECEREKGNFSLAEYYESMRDQFLNGTHERKDDERAERYRRLAEAANNPKKALQFFTESINISPENSPDKSNTMRDGIIAGAMNGMFDETREFITNAVDSTITQLVPCHIDEDDLNRGFLMAQGKWSAIGIVQLYREAEAGGDWELMGKYDKLYKHLMREKYRLFCQHDRPITCNGGYQITPKYCDYMETKVLPAFEMDCFWLDKSCKLPD